MKVVITGTSHGIGRALTERLLGQGHRVWGLARSDQSAFAARHPEVFRCRRCDVARWAEVEAAAAEIAAAWGKIDGLVCCAGWQGEIGRALSADPGRWSETVRSNLDGTYFPLRALAGHFAARPKIVCFSGGGASQARPNFSAYGAAKTALVRLVETIAAEEGSRLDINAVAPGAVTTRMTEEVLRLGPESAGAAEYAAAREQVAKNTATPDRAVALVEWLLSPASDGVTGRLLSARWDPWPIPEKKKAELAKSDAYQLRRVIPS